MNGAHWIFCCGMIRSGSTLQYQIVADLVETFNLGYRVGFVTEEEFLEIYAEKKKENKFLVVKTHECFDIATELLNQNNASGFYTLRDLRDVILSCMRKFNLTFEKLIEKKWIDYAIEQGDCWRECKNILISKYEDIILSPVEEFKKYASHTGLKISEKYTEKLIEKYSLNKQLNRIKEIRPNGLNIIEKEKAIYDSTSLLHSDHIHKGQIEGWKDELTESQIELIENKYRSWLVANKYILFSKH